MARTRVTSDAAPPPAGPYSQGIRVGELVFVAGQSGLDAQSGKYPPGIKAQTELALESIDSILAAAGTSLKHAAKVSVYLADLDDFAAMNDVYRMFVSDPPPVRTTIQAGLAPEMLVEIDAVAVVPPAAA